MIVIVVKAQEGRIIKDITIRIADEMDFEFIRGLQNLGMNRNVASLVTYLKDVTEGSSRDIEIATGMRQPEVSIAMQTMRAMNWVAEHEVKGDGKGRPMKYYALRSTIDEIIGYYEAKKSQEAAQTMEAIHRLKELSFA
jgi:Predicted transcriptional regulator